MLSAVVGGIILTIAAIVIMILCRRSSSLSSLKNLKNRDSPVVSGNQRRQNEYNSTNRKGMANANNKSGPKFKRNNDVTESPDVLSGDSPFLKSNGNGFDLGSNHPLISSEDGPHETNGQSQHRTAHETWNNRGEEETNTIDNQNFNRSNGDYHEFSDNQVKNIGMIVLK